jgi:hypothetical protein
MASNKIIRYSVRKLRGVRDRSQIYCANVRRTRRVDRDGLVDFLAEKNTTVTRQDIVGVLDLLDEVIREQLVMGNSVNTGSFDAVVTIRGRFDSLEDVFDDDRHAVNVSVSATSALKRKIAVDAVLDKSRSTKRVPEIDEVYDFGSAMSDGTVSASHTVEITGANLGVTTENPVQGVDFVNGNTNVETAVELVNRLTDGRIVFEVPESLANGEYSLVIKRAFGSEVHEGKFASIVNVVSARAN